MSILKFIGVPYEVGKGSFDSSDCWGICKLYAKDQLNLILPEYLYSDLNNYEVAENAIKEAEHGLGNQWQKVNEPQHGDIVTFRILGHETHCGIMINSRDFLHSLKGRMSCLEDITNANWKHRIGGFYRWMK